MKKDDQYTLLNEAKAKLTGFTLEKSLQKNPELVEFATNRDIEHRWRTKFAPLVSVEVERSFSQYKSILSHRRHSLTDSNIEILNVIQFNNFFVLRITGK